jgi:hypothetical protein
LENTRATGGKKWTETFSSFGHVRVVFFEGIEEIGGILHK